MELVDANVVLRYILWDNESLAEQAKEVIEEKFIEIPFEVIAEIVYVLEGVYNITRTDIEDFLIKLFEYPNIITTDYDILKYCLSQFSSSNLDFVDCLLLGYNKIKDKKVHTFDKKLNKLLQANA